MKPLAMPDELVYSDEGLIPVILQSVEDEVLTLAYANREALLEMVSTGKTVLWSRSRQSLWRKGESSGNWQEVISISPDCDRDALLVRVRNHGPACHLGNESCFDSQDD